jgi:hypothetical protein
MRKHNNLEKDTISALLYQILDVTSEAKKSIRDNDIENVEKSIKLRGKFITDLKYLSESVKLSSSEFEMIKMIDAETIFLLKSVEQLKDKISLDLISLFNARQVVKYY